MIFDSQVPVGSAQAVYLSALAGSFRATSSSRHVGLLRTRGAQELSAWTLSDVQPPARHRLYRATALEHFVLGEGDQRLPVTI